MVLGPEKGVETEFSKTSEPKMSPCNPFSIPEMGI